MSSTGGKPPVLFTIKAMTIKTIISQETPDAIQCYKHGMFWMAYEKSAYRIWTLKKYKPRCQYIKYLKQWVISVGFTDIGLEDIIRSLSPCERIIEEQGYIKIPLVEERECRGFIPWKESFRIEMNIQKEIEKQILSFPLERKSHMDAYLFCQKLQSELTKTHFYSSVLP